MVESCSGRQTVSIRLRLHPNYGINQEWESSQELRIGRETGLDIVLDDSSVSRFHAVIRPKENGYCLIDQRSTNGSFVSSTNGSLVNTIRLHPFEEATLHVGDF